MKSAEPVWIALGSNLGARDEYLAFARKRLGDLPESAIVGVSPVTETAAVGGPPQGDYLNQMVKLTTTLTPHAVLAALQRIENEAGRDRGERWGPRTLDLDIVVFGERHIAEPDLVVPHPELANRSFWQEQLDFLERNPS